MDKLQLVVTGITAIIPAVISYFVARYQAKTDMKKLSESSKIEIDRLMKQHAINLESLKEKHRLEMEAKDKEQEYKLQLMQKEYELKIQEKQQAKTNDVMTDAMGGFFNDLINNPTEAMGKLNSLKDLGEQLKGFNK